MLSKIEELCIKVQFLWVENSFVSLCKRLVRLLRPKAANYANVISSKIIRILEQVLVSTRLGIERQLTLWCEFGLTFPPLSDIALQISSESCWQAICKSRFLPPIFFINFSCQVRFLRESSHVLLLRLRRQGLPSFFLFCFVFLIFCSGFEVTHSAIGGSNAKSFCLSFQLF